MPPAMLPRAPVPISDVRLARFPVKLLRPPPPNEMRLLLRLEDKDEETPTPTICSCQAACCACKFRTYVCKFWRACAYMYVRVYVSE